MRRKKLLCLIMSALMLAAGQPSLLANAVGSLNSQTTETLWDFSTESQKSDFTFQKYVPGKFATGITDDGDKTLEFKWSDVGYTTSLMLVSDAQDQMNIINAMTIPVVTANVYVDDAADMSSIQLWVKDEQNRTIHG